jgi:signal transduction histidine kinase
LHGKPHPGPIRCWEVFRCGRSECAAYNSSDLRCWLIPHDSYFDGAVGIQARLSSRCGTCSVFGANRERARGKRLPDLAMLDTLDALLCESADTDARLGRAEAESRGKSAQVTLLSEVGRALQRTMEIDQILLVILTAVTAGDGLGFNRAFFLLLDEADGMIKGRMGVGPSHALEAGRIWTAMEREGKSLGEILSGVSAKERAGRNGIDSMTESLSFAASPADNIIARSIELSKSHIVHDGHGLPETRAVASLLRNAHFLVVPLVAEGRKLGAILADNFVTQRPIVQEDVRLVETFASQAALAILNASLHKGLRERIGQLERAQGELMRNQLQLVRAERLVSAGGLASTLIHDLKAPIISIGLMAKAAACGDGAPGPVKDTLDRISEEILRIEDYLKGFAKSAGRGSAKTEWIDPAELVGESLDVLRGAIANGGVEVATDLHHGAAGLVGSRVELRQVLVNILHNSIEAMPNGGKVAISTRAEAPWLKISIEDTGSGIPEDMKSRVFSAFFTTKPDGSGLGLVIARRIVTSHGGRISLESTEGVGTCFHVHLPVSPAPAK